MAKGGGLAGKFYVGGRDVSGSTGAINSCASPRGVLVRTGIDKSAVERLLTTTDGILDWTSFFDDATGEQHEALKSLPTADVLALWQVGQAIGDAAGALTGKQADYPATRGQDMALDFNPKIEGNGLPLEWGETLTPGLRTDTEATNGASLDNGEATSDGLMAQLQVTALTGTNVIATIEESSDNGGGDAFTSLLAMTSVTGVPGSERKTVAGAVERYLRVATSGTFSSASFALMARRGTAFDDVAYT